MFGQSIKRLSCGVVACWGAGACVAACSDSFSSADCRETRTCPLSPGEGGESGAIGGAGGAQDPSSGGDDGALVGGKPDGGTVTVGGSGDGMAGAPSESGACPEGYQPWLSSGFSFPDGEVIGTADFPSMPWVSSGSLELDAGKLTGTGTAVISQGSAFPYSQTRLRYRVSFSGANQEASVAVNAAADGDGGLRVTVAASGELVVSEGQASRGQVTFDPLDTGVEWFVEATFNGPSAHVTLASGNYGKESSLKATVTTDSLTGTAKGAKAAVRLDSSSGIVPAVDEVSVARCGDEAPQYEAKLVDTFERPNSATLGKAELPATATWLDPSATFKIVDGGLQSSGELKAASILLPEQFPLMGLRIRTSVRAVTGGSGPYLWADVNFNVAQGIRGISDNGFWVWGGPTESHFNTGIFPGGGSLTHEVVAETDVYFVQLDRDGDTAVITVREGSFDGPILGVQFSDSLKATPNPGSYLTVGDEGGNGTRWEDIRVDVFPVE